MMTRDRSFKALLANSCAERRYVCVGLDAPKRLLLPHMLSGYDPQDPGSHPQYLFNIDMVKATYDIAGAYKLNIHFYLSQGPPGYLALINTVAFIKAQAPTVPIILDYRSGGLEGTNAQIASAAFDGVGADAATFYPYEGQVEMARMLSDRRNNGVILVCRSGNNDLFPEDLQNVEIATDENFVAPVWEYVAHHAKRHWNEAGNCCLEMPAAYPEQIEQVRTIVGAMPLLVTDGGLQDCELHDVAHAAIRPSHMAMISTSFENVLEGPTPDFARLVRAEVKEMHDVIRAALPF